MNNLICGLDDPRIRFKPEVIDADEDQRLQTRTDMERRLEWLCDEWADAQAADMLDEWRDVRMAIHGAIQALNFCHADQRHDDRMALMTLGSVAFQHSQDCIRDGKYEGATK